MGEAGHHRFGMLVRSFDQHPLECADRIDRLVAGIAHPQPEIGRDLVVARARRVQPSRRRPDQLRKPASRRSCGCPRARAARERRRAHIRRRSGPGLRGSRGVRFGDDPLLAQHRRMRLRRRNVLPPQALVEADRRVDARHQLVRSAPEPAAPGALRTFGVLSAMPRALPCAWAGSNECRCGGQDVALRLWLWRIP